MIYHLSRKINFNIVEKIWSKSIFKNNTWIKNIYFDEKLFLILFNTFDKENMFFPYLYMTCNHIEKHYSTSKAGEPYITDL